MDRIHAYYINFALFCHAVIIYRTIHSTTAWPSSPCATPRTSPVPWASANTAKSSGLRPGLLPDRIAGGFYCH
jgi:hypothetical protein